LHLIWLASYNTTDCAVCAHDYTRSGGYKCNACSSRADRATIATASIILIILLAVAWYVVLDLLAVDERSMGGSSFRTSVSVIVVSLFDRVSAWFKAVPWNSLRVPLVVMQTLTQYVNITGLELPPLYQRFLSWLSVINLDLQWLLSAGCIVRINFYGKLLTTTLLPIFLMAVLGAMHLYVRYKYRAKSSATVRQAARNAEAISTAIAKHSRALLAFTFLIYSPVSTVVFQTFACDYLEGTQSNWLRADYSISCESHTYKAYRVYGVFMILLFPLGIPALYSALLWKHRERVVNTDNDQRDDDVTLNSTRFLWSPYRSEVYWWEVVECIRRLLLAGFLVFILPGSPGQAAVSCVFAILSMVAFGYYRPFLSALDTRNYWLGCVILFLSMFVALLLKVRYGGVGESTSKPVLSIALILLTTWLFSSALFQLIVITCRAHAGAQRARGSLRQLLGRASSRRASGSQRPLTSFNSSSVYELDDDADDDTEAVNNDNSNNVQIDESMQTAAPQLGSRLHRRGLFRDINGSGSGSGSSKKKKAASVGPRV
jgi:hypothetical protein